MWTLQTNFYHQTLSFEALFRLLDGLSMSSVFSKVELTMMQYLEVLERIGYRRDYLVGFLLLHSMVSFGLSRDLTTSEPLFVFL